jgi:hypothetical protein
VVKLIYQLFAAVIVTSKPTFDYNALAVIMGPGKNISIPSILYLVFLLAKTGRSRMHRQSYFTSHQQTSSNREELRHNCSCNANTGQAGQKAQG